MNTGARQGERSLPAPISVEKWKDTPRAPILLAENRQFIEKAKFSLECWAVPHFVVHELADAERIGNSLKARRPPGQTFEFLYVGDATPASRKLETALRTRFLGDPWLPCGWRRIALPIAGPLGGRQVRAIWASTLTETEACSLVLAAIEPFTNPSLPPWGCDPTGDAASVS